MSSQSNNNQNEVKVAIKAYLNKRAQEDTLFAATYAKPNKSIDECFDYIIGEVSKKGNAVYMSDEKVFGMAVHYYDEDDIKVSPLPNGMKVKSSATAELTDEEKADIKAQAIQAYKQRCIDEEAAKAKELAKKRREAKRNAQHEQDVLQLSLFGEGEL
jgi:hypothetical protein